MPGIPIFQLQKVLWRPVSSDVSSQSALLGLLLCYFAVLKNRWGMKQWPTHVQPPRDFRSVPRALFPLMGRGS